MTVPVSVIVLTLNEEAYVERCLGQLLPWADEVLVVDSGSTDRTVAQAEAAGARVLHQPWLGWSPQHNAGLDAARNDWCLFVDADEIVDDRLSESIAAALAAAPDPRTMFVVERIEEIAGVILPSMRRRSKRLTLVRLFNRRHAQYDPEMLIHEEVVGDGPRVMLEGGLLHWRNADLDLRFTQNNRNATIEAAALAKDGARWSALRIATKPILRFLWCYVWCGGWRAGAAGLVYCMSAADAEFMRQAKLWELQAVERQQHPPKHLYVGNGTKATKPQALRLGAQN